MQGSLESLSIIFLFQEFSPATELASLESKLSSDLLSGESFGTKFMFLFRLLSLSAGTPLYTAIRSQYCSQTDRIFHRAKIIADAFNDTKLTINPVKTGAKSLQVKSILRITEFIFVRVSGGWPFEITTTLHSVQCQSLKKKSV